MTGAKPKADEKSDDTEAEERKPVWNVATQGPIPDDREGVYEVVLPAEPMEVTNPSGVPVSQVNADDEAKSDDK